MVAGYAGGLVFQDVALVTLSDGDATLSAPEHFPPP